MNRFHICCVLAFTLLTVDAFCQGGDLEIAHIRTVFSSVNADLKLKRLSLDMTDFFDQTPDDGGEITGYFSGDHIVKISVWMGLSFGPRTIDYYFENSQLIFAYVVERHYRVDRDSIDRDKLLPVFEGRYYFQNEKLISKVLKGQGFWDNDDAKQLVSDSKDYSKILKGQFKKEN